MRELDLKPEDFPDKKVLRRFEGGVVYTAERDGRYYLITDERTLADLSSEEDREGLSFTSVREFDTKGEALAYARTRHWL